MADNAISFSVSPCLFIGIGTNGWRIIDDLRQLFFEEFGVGGLPCFRYIAIETNAGRMPDDSFLPHEPKTFEKITPVYITIPDISVVKKRIDPRLDQEYKPGLREWLDQKLVERGNKSYQGGAGNARHAGRLCLWQNWDAVKRSITEGYEAITTVQGRIQADSFLREEYFGKKKSGAIVPPDNLVNPAPKVYIFGTLCGGTCSGAFIDIAYFVSDLLGVKRSVVLKRAKEPEVIGLFTIVDSIRVSQPNLRANVANCWAALRELDFYYQPESVYSAKFPDGTAIRTRDEPFDTVYLAAMRNMANAGFTGEDYLGLTQMCAMNLFTEVVAGMSAKKDENRVNLKATSAGYLQPNQTGHIRAFSSFGLSAIWYPRYRIAKAINRHLGMEMCDTWLGGNDVPISAVEEEGKRHWEDLQARARGSLLGTVDGAHCNVNLPMEIDQMFEQREAEFQAVDEYGLDEFTVNFPSADNALSLRLANPNGEYYKKISNAENLVARDLKLAFEKRIIDFLREHTFAETKVYLGALIKLAAEQAAQLPDEIPAFSQKMDFNMAHDVHRDVWTKWLFLKDAAVTEYKQAIWGDFRQRVVRQLEQIRDHFLKRILNNAQADFIAIAGRVARAEHRLRVLRDTSDTEKKQQIDFHHASNIVPISEGDPDSIADDVSTGASEILKTTDRMSLRRMFLGEENPLLTLESRPVRDMVAALDQQYDALSQKIIKRFHIGKEVLAHLTGRIEHLVQSSVPYVETTAAHRPISTAQSPNFLFCHDLEAAKALAELTQSYLATARYNSAPSPLDHFVIFYQEAPGLAISDLVIAEFAFRLLDEVERNPDKIATHYTHQMGEKMFNLKAIREFELLSRWLRVMRYLDPDLFKSMKGQAFIEYDTPQKLRRDLLVDNDDAIREYIETYTSTPLRELFATRLKALGKQETIQRMEAKKNEAQTLDERQSIQDMHHNILTTVFS